MQRRGLVLLGILLVISPRSLSQDVWIETTIYMSDGIALDARIVKPLGLPPSGGFPGVVLVHGYGGNKDQMQTVQAAIAAYGYASLAYSVRGQGNSEGLSTISGDREREDLLSVIQFFRSTSNINPNKLGIAGGSQGGIHSWMAAVHRMPGIQVAAPLIATPDFAKALIPNGCVTAGLPKEMTVSTVRYSADRDRVKGFIIADQYDSVLSYVNARDLAYRVGNVQIPILQALGWHDFLFPANGGIRARDTIRSHGVPIWSFYGTNGHGQPIDPAGAVLALDKVVAWFDRWLKGFSLVNDSLPMVFYCDDRFSSPEESAMEWPPRGAMKKIWFLTATGLSNSPPLNDSPAKLPFTIGHDPAYTGAMGWGDEYKDARFLSAFPSTPLRIVSEPFGTEVEFSGIPTGQIFVSSDAGKFQAHVRVFDVASDILGGGWTLISRSTNGVRDNTPGETHRIQFEGTAISHFIPAGNRLGVEITSLDMLDDTQAFTIPYFEPANSLVLTSSSQPSYIAINDTLVGAVSEEGDRAPRALKLDQNFPNPFNPATVIGYEVPEAGHVMLAVYDLLGREVAVLVDEKKPAGNYSVRFDGTRCASGMYLYRLIAGKHSETRKMSLVR